MLKVAYFFLNNITDKEQLGRLGQLHGALPVTADSGNGLEAARCQLVRPSEAAVHSPVEQIDLVWVQF